MLGLAKLSNLVHDGLVFHGRHPPPRNLSRSTRRLHLSVFRRQFDRVVLRGCRTRVPGCRIALPIHKPSKKWLRIVEEKGPSKDPPFGFRRIVVYK